MSQSSSQLSAEHAATSESPESEPHQENRKDPNVTSYQPSGKFYCRRKEHGELLQAYQRMKASTDASKTSVVVYKGDFGVGKTSLALTLRPIVEKDGGYFIVGKFERITEPHATLVSAFSDFASAVIERGDLEVERIRKAVAGIDETDRNLLAAVIPPLKLLFGMEDEQKGEDHGEHEAFQSPEIISGTLHRFKQAVQRLVRSISSREKPLVCFMENFHYADEGSVDLLRTSIINDTHNLGVLIVATFREKVDGPAHGTILEMLPKPSQGMMDRAITHLVPLSEKEVGSVLSQELSVDQETIKSLSVFIFKQSRGNFLAVFECIRTLFDEGLLRYEESKLKWDIEEIEIELGIFSDLLLRRISKLPDQTKDLLKVASCFGSRLDDRLLMHFAPGPVLHFYEEVRKKGLIFLDEKRDCWKFSYAETVYENMPPSERTQVHYRIARTLWRKFDMETLDRNIFIVVGHFIEAQALIKNQKEMVAVAKLSLRAGEQAVFLSNFFTAYRYLMHAINLLEPRSWIDEYDLCLQLHNHLSEVAYTTGHSTTVFKLVRSILENARSFSDTIRCRTLAIYATGSGGRLQEATDMSLEFLRLLGEPVPSKPNLSDAFFAVRQLKRMLKSKTNEYILRLPVMENQEKIAAMQVLVLSFMYALSTGGRNVGAVMAARIIKLTLKFGLTPVSCVGFSLCAAGLW